ncbi:MAG: Ig-like domain-containing protein [Gemmatimonadales bacterium]
MRVTRSIGAIVFATVLTACGGGGGGGSPSTSLSLAKPASSGDAQQAEVGHAVTAAIKVLVKLDTSVSAGHTITWAASASGSASPPTSQSGVDGIASTSWTLGSTPGSQSLTATLAGAAGSPLTYTATAIAPVVAKSTVSGNAQSDTVHATLATPLSVDVTLGGVPQSGRTIVWSTGNPGGTVIAIDTTASTTGTATAHWKLGTVAGTQSATATTAGAVAGVSFTATARPGLAKTLTAVSGDSQIVDTSQALPDLLLVKAIDQFGNARSGVTVQWSAPSANATVSPASDTTAANGMASASVTSGASTGAVTVTATASGLTGSPVTFGATITHSALFTIQVENDTFTKDSLIIHAGDQVRWVWSATAVTHNVTSDPSPSFTSSVNLGANATYGPITFATPGLYYYHCTIHGATRSGMYGVIVVQ